MIVNTNLKERIKTMGVLILQSYKILMGTMTALFIPQKCYNLIDVNDAHLCSITENLNKEDKVTKITLGFNVFTAFTFMVLYFVEMQREQWLIKNLDIDHNKADNYLSNKLSQECNDNILINIKKSLYKYNNYYYYTSIGTISIFVINNLASISLLSDNNYGTTTITTYVSFLLLILVKLYNSMFVSYISRKKHRALSAYMVEFSSFNSIDDTTINHTDDEMINIVKI